MYKSHSLFAIIMLVTLTVINAGIADKSHEVLSATMSSAEIWGFSLITLCVVTLACMWMAKSEAMKAVAGIIGASLFVITMMAIGSVFYAGLVITSLIMLAVFATLKAMAGIK